MKKLRPDPMSQNSSRSKENYLIDLFLKNKNCFYYVRLEKWIYYRDIGAHVTHEKVFTKTNEKQDFFSKIEFDA